jgi:hypothetical protein
LDPVFTQADNPDHAGNPPFDGKPHETLRFFWTLSAREGMASELAALNLAEYDGFPFAYYFDCAKQIYDEARHAVFYLSMVSQVYRVLSDDLDPSSFEARAVERYLTSGDGLPIPYEGTCYTSVWNASLVERLVLMNLRTEGPSISAKRQRLQSRLCNALPELREGIAMDMLDEASHAKLGARWIQYLYPDSEERSLQIGNADLMRGFIMSLTIAERQQVSATELMIELSGGRHG